MDLEATRASKRPELLSMADDYARHALSQRAAFEAIHPAVMTAAEPKASRRWEAATRHAFVGRSTSA